MRPHVFADHVVRPALLGFAPVRYATPEATCLLTAIALQETGLIHRRQMEHVDEASGRYGLGRYQNERPTVALILGHAALDFVRQAVREMDYPLDPVEVHRATADNDLLATVLARGLLVPDPGRVPAAVHDDAARDAGWAIYKRVWRPGRERPETWDRNWHLAVEATTGVQITPNPLMVPPA